VPDLLVLGLKALIAGAMVVAFSVLAQRLRPQMFAGLFAGAPVVAAVSLAITAFVKPAAVEPNAVGMIAGSVGMIVCCVVAALVTSRFNSYIASALAWVAWALVAFGLYFVFLA
jgi:hypothetical protein